MTQDPQANTAGHALCRLHAIDEGDAVAVTARIHGAEETLVVLRRGEQAFAYLNACPHTGRRLDFAPGRFMVDDDILICPGHGASFRADTGYCTGGPCQGENLQQVPVTISADGDVCLAGGTSP